MSDLILRSRSAALGAGLLTSPDQPTVGLPPLLVCCGVRLRFVGPVWSGRSGGDLRSKWCGVRRPAHSAEVVRGQETRAQRRSGAGSGDPRTARDSSGCHGSAQRDLEPAEPIDKIYKAVLEPRSRCVDLLLEDRTSLREKKALSYGGCLLQFRSGTCQM